VWNTQFFTYYYTWSIKIIQTRQSNTEQQFNSETVIFRVQINVHNKHVSMINKSIRYVYINIGYDHIGYNLRYTLTIIFSLFYYTKTI